jgi:hypothetical protein
MAQPLANKNMMTNALAADFMTSQARPGLPAFSRHSSRANRIAHIAPVQIAIHVDVFIIFSPRWAPVTTALFYVLRCDGMDGMDGMGG